MTDNEKEIIRYRYNANNKNLYLSLTYEIFLDCTTEIKPPEYLENTIPCFDKEKQLWYIISDYRNQIIYDKSNSLLQKQQLFLGEIDLEYTLITPPDFIKSYKFLNNLWINNFNITKTLLSNFLYLLKCKIAYTGINIIKDDLIYIFETDSNSITMSNSTYNRLLTKEDDYTIWWKVYQDNNVSSIQLTKKEFLKVFDFGMDMINNAFGVLGLQNDIVNNMTETDLTNLTYINLFKENSIEKFNTINKTFDLATIDSF